MEGIDWGYIAFAVIALLAVLFLGGYYRKLKKEITEFVDIIQWAIEDDEIDDAEIARIIQEGKDIGRTLKEMTLNIIQIIPRK